MPPKIVRVPGIETLALPTARQSIPPLHSYLRARIMDGTLPPGTKVSQASLADQLGVSRTPLREVLRMLQDEGLVTAEPNQRMQVAPLDPVVLDSDYSARIMLGALAMAMTMQQFGPVQRRDAQKLLTRMRRAARRKDIQEWLDAHDAFHGVFEAGAPLPLQRQLRLLSERSVRYIRIRQREESTQWADVGELEHPAILDAVVDNDEQAAIAALTRHLAGTVLRVLASSAPQYQPTAVRRAAALVEQTSVDTADQETPFTAGRP